jgi:hypothetical protein
MRALRIGVVLNGTLVEERTFSDGQPITVGQSLRCRLSVPADGVPFEMTLFRVANGRYVLDGAPLEPGARGKVAVGEAVILYQDLPQPPKPVRLQLPASIKSTLADRIDRRVAVIVGLSVFVHLGIAAWASLTDGDAELALPLPNAVYIPPQHDGEIVIDAAQVPDAAPGVAAPASPVQTAPSIVRPARITSADKPMTVDDANRVAQILTGNDETRGGQHEMNRRQVGADLKDQIDDITRNGRNVRVGDDPRTRDQGARRGTDRGLQLDSQRSIDHMEKTREPEFIVWAPPAGKPPKRTLTIDMVLAKIQGQYMQGLQRCYKRELAGDGGAQGKINLQFTVDERGHTIDVEAKGVSRELETCVAGQMAGWLFPIPKNEAGEADEAAFKLALAFRPAD